MKLQFLGTAAAEGFPAVFCNCKFCQEAKALGGKNIRTRSQAIINDDLLLDFPADTYHHFLQNNIDGDKIKYLFVTHSHADHLYVDDLAMRKSAYSHDMREEMLYIYCSAGAYEKISKLGPKLRGAQLQALEPFQTVCAGAYEVTALPARHAAGDGALIYIIRGDKTILYAHDTGYFYEEVFDFIEKNGIVFDLVTLDCTCVDIIVDDESFHMGIPNNQRVFARLEQIGAVTDQTVRYINHFSHNANPVHHVLEERVASLGYRVSYDGCCVEL